MRVLSCDSLLETHSMEYFQALSSFGAISDKTVLKLLNEGKIIQLSKGEEVYHQGATVRGFNVILAGSVSLYVHSSSGLALTHIYSQGEQIGFVGMIALHKRKGTAVADGSTIVLEIKADQFFALHESSPQDFGLLMLNLSREMARTIGDMGNTISSLRNELANKGNS
ncbi:MAG: cyclic nucleotide-binding domain-containing protein [Amphritea sp.]